MRRPDAPYRRIYDSGREAWVARYTCPISGERKYARPHWNHGSSVFDRKGDAQRAINEAIEETVLPETDTIAGYLPKWLKHYPRSPRTDDTNESKIKNTVKLEIEGRKVGDWELVALRRRHVRELIGLLFEEQGRAPGGVRAVIRTFSTMFEDAINDELAALNPFRGVKIKDGDRRAKKLNRKPRVLTLEQMHSFAAAAKQPIHEAMIRVLSDCGLRLGEMLALPREFGYQTLLVVRGSAYHGYIIPSSAQKNHDRKVPVPSGLSKLINALPPRLDAARACSACLVVQERPVCGRCGARTVALLFPTTRGLLWRERNFYRNVWNPCREATGIDVTPHDFRHSWESHLQAAGIDPADLAKVAGHAVETMMQRYVHALEKSHEEIRDAIG